MSIKKVLGRFINIVPVEDTFFVLIKKPQNIKLTKEAIYLNYKHLSPFKDGDLIYLQTKNNIFIWFTKYKLIDKNKIYIPEGYLIYKNLKEKKEAIAITQKEKGVYILSVVKDGLLLSQIVVKENNLKQKITFLKKEYSLKNPEEVNFPISKLKVSLTDIIIFLQFSLPKKDLYEKVLPAISVPIVAFIVSITGFYFFLNKYLEHEISKKQVYLNSLKKKTKDIKNLLYELEEKKQFWETFIKNEKKYPSVYFTLNKIMEVLDKKGGYVNHIELSENVITMWAGLKTGETNIVNDLLKTGIFKEVRVISSVKDRTNKGYEIVNLEIYLKEKI